MKYCDKCDTTLQQHICNNTDELKRLFVCTLQNMYILLQTDDLDSYFDHDMIVHTMTNNCIDNNYLHSDEEWLQDIKSYYDAKLYNGINDGISNNWHSLILM